jgi:phospholipid N-methyltransferase
MLLSELVKTKNYLKSLSLNAVRTDTEELDGHVSHILTFPLHLTYQDDLSSVISKIDHIESELTAIEKSVNNLIDKIDEEISDRTQDFLARGYIVSGFYGSNRTDVPTERSARLLPMRDETRSEIVVTAKKHTHWKYPCLEIGPGDGFWTEYLVAGDPLYIVDQHQEFLDSTVEKFNPVYQKRIRPYLTGIHANRSDTDLSMLPHNQFGFIFSWNVFNYLPLAETQSMLEQSFDLLRPGGIMMFSYNNCDSPQCTEFVEKGFRSWMPSKLLLDTCKSIGFEIIHNITKEETIHWVEIKKPGVLKTVKGHQVLGEISSQTA